MSVIDRFVRFCDGILINTTCSNRSGPPVNRKSFKFFLILIFASLASLMQAGPAHAQALTEGWTGIVPGSNDYANPVLYSEPAEACQSVQYSFVPYFGYGVFELIEVRASPDLPNPNTGLEQPTSACWRN